MEWTELADDETVERTAEALRKRNVDVMVVNTGVDAKTKVLELLPKGVEIMQASSTTLDQIGVSQELEESGNYRALRKSIKSIDDPKQRYDARRKALGAEYAVGSVQAVTEAGQIVVASASGSQIPLYSYGAANVILVVGTQKIVKDLDAAMKRIYEYALALESKRIGKGSSVNKIYLLEREGQQGRVRLIFVKERLGF
ncbi:MAG: lactate utilization protein [Candidatus Micrarchaeota archaeon]|nr:lactate utilization protein [Candidatus Micrarchaeota archaeon]